MSVYERIGEIGTIAAIGTPPSKILSLFIIEGFAMGLLSTVFGVILSVGSLLMMSMTNLNFKFGQMNVTLNPSIPTGEVITTTIIVLFISILASFQPAYKASKMEPVDALGHT